ncbi:MAG: hypothetical protein IKX31_07190 [Muribaculaceae bacterium]|nr:hypothetical protein [Muribaculaceae bacterium]
MNILKHFYIQLSRYNKSRFRDALIEACGWSYGTFYYKMKHGNISKLELEVVSDHIKAFLF